MLMVNRSKKREKMKKQMKPKKRKKRMIPLKTKKREKMVERVKKQYMDLLSEEELERIILTSE